MSETLERCLWCVCAVLIGAFALGRLGASQAAEQQIEAFERDRQRVAADEELHTPVPDQADWSTVRIAQFAAGTGAGAVEGILSIPTLNVAAPIKAGTDKATLNVSVGRVTWGAQVGEAGNLILAGHRDSFFRRLGQLASGDTLTVEASDRTWNYEVFDTSIVDPDDVDAVRWTPDHTLTLITCYPFYFVGPAPKRFLVFARLQTDQKDFSTSSLLTGG